MDVIFSILFPVFAIILAGYVAGRASWVDIAHSRILNNFVYYVALPPMFFKYLATVPLGEVFNLPFLVAYGGSLYLTLAISLVGARFLFRLTAPQMAIHGMTALFGNVIYMGIPIFIAAFGPDRILPGLIASLFQVTLLVAPLIAAVDVTLKGVTGLRQLIRDVARVLVTNPLVVSAFAGILFSFAQIDLPVAVIRLSDLLASASAPVALFALGVFLVGKPVNDGVAEISWLVGVKMIVHPLMAYWLAFMVLDMNPFWAWATVILAACPSGTLAFVIAQRYGVYVGRASTAILVSTVLSVFLLSGLLYFAGL